MPGQYEGEITRFCLREQGSNPRNLRRPARGRGELYQLQRRSDRGRPEPDLRGKPHADRSRCGLHAREQRCAIRDLRLRRLNKAIRAVGDDAPRYRALLGGPRRALPLSISSHVTERQQSSIDISQ